MRSLISSFSRNDKGGVAILAAFTCPLALLAIGCAVDFARATALRTQLQDATDSAALIAAKAAPALNDQDLLTAATKTCKARITDATAKIESLTVSNGRRKVELKSSDVTKPA